MSEIKTPVVELNKGQTLKKSGYLITNKHTIADIARWIVEQGMKEDIEYELNHIED